MEQEQVVRRGFVYLYFNNLRNYSEEMEQMLERRLQTHEEEYKKVFAEETDDKYLEFLTDQYSDRKSELTDTYPTLLRSSLMNSIYLVIEKELQDVCSRLQSQKGIKMNLKDADLQVRTKKGMKSPSEIVRAQLYLKEYCGVKFPENAPEWKQISEGYRIIRNKFVHEGQHASKNEVGKFKEIAEFVPQFRLDDEHRELILEKGFCDQFIVAGEHFFMRLYKSIKENI